MIPVILIFGIFAIISSSKRSNNRHDILMEDIVKGTVEGISKDIGGKK